MNILEEANSLVHGDRGAAYGHPLDDYTRTAALVSAMLAHKLKEPITAEEMILAMCCVKLSRQINLPKRDNMTDLAGYAECQQMAIEERAKRQLNMLEDRFPVLTDAVDESVPSFLRPGENPLFAHREA